MVDAETKVAITAREVAKVRSQSASPWHPLTEGFVQMVLVTSQIHIDEDSPDGGVLKISFPDDSGCESFGVPLRPSEATLMTWQS